MNIVILICAVYGFMFAIKETDGPWGVMNWFRRILLSNKYVGVFFYKLLNCAYCSGAWSGVIVYLLTTQCIKLNELLIWGLAGGTICLIIDGVLAFLHRE
jgi:hypothetical protein